MTYIGNPQGTGFSKIDSQQFSGTGSKTAYTMRHPVSQAEHVAVYVNNVRQDPHMAYTVSGTTLTFTEAPSNATNNIYVVYLGGAINTTELPTDVSLGVKGGIINAPSIFKHGEIQTGAYFPAANTVALVQGGKEILRANNSLLELKISGTTVATINSTGMNITGGIFDDGAALSATASINPDANLLPDIVPKAILASVIAPVFILLVTTLPAAIACCVIIPALNCVLADSKSLDFNSVFPTLPVAIA